MEKGSKEAIPTSRQWNLSSWFRLPLAVSEPYLCHHISHQVYEYGILEAYGKLRHNVIICSYLARRRIKPTKQALKWVLGPTGPDGEITSGNVLSYLKGEIWYFTMESSSKGAAFQL
jgi:hypothetical protein